MQEGPVGGHLGGEAACWGGAGLGTLPLIGGGARDTPLVGGALGHSPLVGVEPDDTRPLVGGAWGHAPSRAPGDTPGTQTRRALPHPQRPVLGPQGPLLGSEAMGTPGLLVIEALPSALQIQFPFLSLLLFLLLPPPLPPPPSFSSSSFLLLFLPGKCSRSGWVRLNSPSRLKTLPGATPPPQTCCIPAQRVHFLLSEHISNISVQCISHCFILECPTLSLMKSCPISRPNSNVTTSKKSSWTPRSYHFPLINSFNKQAPE